MSGYDYTSSIDTGFNFTDGDGGDEDGIRRGGLFEQWLTTGTTEPLGWTYTGSDGTSRSYQDPTDTIQERYVQLSCGALPNSSAALSTEALGYFDGLGFGTRDGEIITEWTARTGPAITGLGGLDYVGAVNSSHFGLWNYLIGFRLAPQINANVLVVISNAFGVTSIDTGIPVAVNTTYLLRLELVGASIDPGGAIDPRVRAYVNGTLVYNALYKTPNDTWRLEHIVANGADDPNDPYTMFIGSHKTTWRL